MYYGGLFFTVLMSLINKVRPDTKFKARRADSEPGSFTPSTRTNYASSRKVSTIQSANDGV